MSIFHPYIEDSDLDKKIHQYGGGKTKTLRPLSKIISDCPKDAIEDMYKWIMMTVDRWEGYDFGGYQIKRQIIIQNFYEIHPNFPNKTYEFGDWKLKKYSPKKSLNELIKELEEENKKIEQGRQEFIEEGKRITAKRRFDDIKTALTGILIIFVIVGLVVQYVKESNCESVTYYEYGVKKTAKVCDEATKYRLRNNIDETKKRRNP